MQFYTEQQYIEAGEPYGPIDNMPAMPWFVRLLVRLHNLLHRGA